MADKGITTISVSEFERMEKQIATLTKELAEANKQLTDFEHMSEYSNVIRQYQKAAVVADEEMEIAEKREAVLREALEKLKRLVPWGGNKRSMGIHVMRTASAALKGEAKVTAREGG